MWARDPTPKVTCLQARPIQSVHESVDDAGAVIDVQRGVPSLPLRGAGRRGRGSKVAFLVTEFRLPSSSWPPCVTTLKSFAHHVRFAKIQGGHFSSPRRLSPPESWTFSARGGKGRHEIGIKAQLVQDQLFITPPLPPLCKEGKVGGVWSFSPLAKGGHRGVLRVPLRCARFGIQANENRSDPIQGTQIRSPAHNPGANAAKQFSVSQSRTSTTGKPASRVFS